MKEVRLAFFCLAIIAIVAASAAFAEEQVPQQGERYGIGITPRLSNQNRESPTIPVLKVASVFCGSPAHKAGIVAGDVIIDIDGVSTVGALLQNIDVSDLTSDSKPRVMTLTLRRPLSDGLSLKILILRTEKVDTARKC